MEYTAKQVGELGERLAAKHLKKIGYRILGKNLHFGKNELDLVAKDGRFLVFVEVKARSFEGELPIARPADAVDLGKRRRTVLAALNYLKVHPSPLCPRFDVVEVYLDREQHLKPTKINHILDAFTASGKTRR